MALRLEEALMCLQSVCLYISAVQRLTARNTTLNIPASALQVKTESLNIKSCCSGGKSSTLTRAVHLQFEVTCYFKVYKIQDIVIDRNTKKKKLSR